MDTWGNRLKGLLVFLLAFSLADDAFAKKDFKGLFGNYRREKFTENEARDTDFGVDIMLSTLLPVSQVATSSQDGSTFSGMNYATFFNYEASFFVTLAYKWELTLNVGSYSYSTRKQNAVTDPSQNALPLFHQFDMSIYPVLLGVKYRFSTQDIVPYVGVAGGVSFVDRKGSYDYSTIYNEQHLTAFTAQINGGVEFYFAPRAGIRLEMGATYFNMPSFTFTTLGQAAQFPLITYAANPISIRYASGLFFLF